MLKVNSFYIEPFHEFFEKLIDDILNFGTLPQKILKDIANWTFDPSDEKKIKKLIDEIQQVKEFCFNNYFEKNQQDSLKIKNQIIIAIENQKI